MKRTMYIVNKWRRRINFYCVAFLVILASSVLATAAEKGKQLFILPGQSNMKKPDPGVSFTPAVEVALGKEHFIVVRYPEGGRLIAMWYEAWKPAKGSPPEATGELYDRRMVAVNAAIQGKHIKKPQG